MKTEKKKPSFLRRDWYKKSKLGRKRKKKQVWRKPKGRHIKTRLKLRGKSKQPSIGYRADKEIRGTINGRMPLLVHNVQEINNIKDPKNKVVIIAKTVGRLKKIDIVKKALELKIKIENVDAEKFLLEVEEMKKKKTEEKKEKAKKEKKEESKAEEKKEEKNEEKETTEEKEEEKKEKEKAEILKKEIPKAPHQEAQPKKAQKAPMFRKALKK